jgi:hypothetical protein
MILNAKSEKSTRYTTNRKQPVYVHRLKKVTHASRESIRILSEIFEEPPQKFPALSGDGKCEPRRVRLPPETVGRRYPRQTELNKLDKTNRK